MNNMKHTPGPWIVGRRDILDDLQIRTPDGQLIGACESETDPEANAARIVACVNALEGVKDPAALMAAVMYVIETIGHAQHEDALADLVEAFR